VTVSRAPVEPRACPSATDPPLTLTISSLAPSIRFDIVHRHDVPRFERVSWKFVDAHVQRTIDMAGYWRNLPKTEQEAIARRFWEVGRLTLE
jgi:hypothetical protein